jgi:tetratricopeptide (TPR) repeat protein
LARASCLLLAAEGEARTVGRVSAGSPQENWTGPLRIFVAMPGSEMGSDATWTDPDQIKRFFYEVIAERVRSELGLPVDLVIEKDKYLAGPIYSSMYSEAWTADVYLADLTGGNANVYLELGVRWAMSDGVTILLAQDPAKLKFNVAATRAEPYSIDPDVRERSIDRVVRSIVEGLQVKKRGGTDSPVRENGKVLSISASELADLRSEVDRLRSERGESYLEMAKTAHNLTDKIELLRRAVQVNPLVAESRFELGLALRESGNAADAVEHLEMAARFSPGVASHWRELGVALSKSARPDAAVPAFQRAIELDPSDFDAVSALGGAQRRLALARGPDGIDWARLEAARDTYERAATIKPLDTYPLLNVARIDLLLSRRDPDRREAARARFGDVLPLAEYAWKEATRAAARADRNVHERQQEAAYKAFDHADCLLFSGDVKEGLDAYRSAVAVVPADLRRDVLRSVAAGARSRCISGTLTARPGYVANLRPRPRHRAPHSAGRAGHASDQAASGPGHEAGVEATGKRVNTPYPSGTRLAPASRTTLRTMPAPSPRMPSATATPDHEPLVPVTSRCAKSGSALAR